MSTFQSILALASKQTAASQTALAKENQLRQAREKAKRLEEERKEKERTRLEKERLARQKIEDEKREKRLAEELQRRQAERAAIAAEKKKDDQLQQQQPRQSNSRSVRQNNGSPRTHTPARSSNSTPVPSRAKDPEEARRIEREEKQARAKARLFGEPVSAYKKTTQKASTSAPSQRNGHQSSSKAPLRRPIVGQVSTLKQSSSSSSSSPSTSTSISARQRIHQQLSAEGMQPLNRFKRDRRTIEEIERDMRRKKEASSGVPSEFKDFSPQPGRVALTSRPVTNSHQSSLRNSLPSGLDIKRKHSPGSEPVQPFKRQRPDQGPEKVVRSRSQGAQSGTNSRGSATSQRPLKPDPRRPKESGSDYEDEEEEEEEEDESLYEDDALDGGQAVPGAIRDEIWKIMGKDRRQYATRRVISDDEDSDDMEADADDVLEEEGRAARLARIEDQKEQEALRRHELEKKKRQSLQSQSQQNSNRIIK